MVKVREFSIIDENGKINDDLWLENLKKYHFSNIEKIKKAIELVKSWVEKKDDISTEKKDLYYLQGHFMANILSELNLDEDTICAAILFNFVHDLKFSLSDVSKILGESVSGIIKGVMKMDAIRDLQVKNIDSKLHADKIRKMLLAMVEDVRVVVVRLAEHLCEMRDAANKSEKIKREIAEETLNIYAPLSNRLGIGQIKWELEDLSFRYLQPKEYKYIAKLLDEKRIDRENYINSVVEKIEKELAAENIKADVLGRPKHIYSIWRKMQKKNLDYDQIYDIRAIRVLTQKVSDCYAALGVVHSIWRHIPKEFDDYIALPKDNGYQSLHTAVIGPEGKVVEIQIRTEQMHKDAELGVAAHWRYKEGVNHDASFENKIAWLRQLLEWQEEVADNSDIIEELKEDISEDRVYVLTPNGDIMDFPEGATPLDFAYSVHTSIGHRCRGAKVNGHMVPLTYKMKTGDQLEILTSNIESPSRDWLNTHLEYIKTPRARTKIQSWFKKQDYDDNVHEGRELLNKELNRLGFKDVNFDIVSSKLKYKTVNDLYANYGTGDVKISQILGAVDGLKKEKDVLETLPIHKKFTKKSNYEKSVSVQGFDDLLTTISRCCKPIPGDKIIGFITHGRGVSIHRTDCSNMQYLEETNPERCIPADWVDDSYDKNHNVDIQIISFDRAGLLKDITGVLSAAKVNILALYTVTDPKTYKVNTKITLEVSSLDELGKILSNLANVPNVKEVNRVS